MEGGRREKLTVDQQVEHLRGSGVRFELCSEGEARAFLSERNFFFKVKAYDNNFDKYTDEGHPDLGKYVDLDFAYLVELSRLDRALRSCAMADALDIEHYLKVRLNAAVSGDGDADGYDVVEGYLAASAVVAAVDLLITLPFLRTYDKQLLAEETAGEQE